MSFDVSLIKSLMEMNDDFKQKFAQQKNFSKHELRSLLKEHIGIFTDNYSPFPFKKIFAIDGSYNTYGDNYPFVVHLLKAGAYGTGNTLYENSSLLYATNSKIQEKIYSIQQSKGLDSEETAYDFLKKQESARLEILMGIEVIKTEKPEVIMFDGGLLRYKNLCPDEYQVYKKMAEDNNIITIGVIEDIGTFIIAKTITDKEIDFKPFQYDREVLYGLLNLYESLIVNDNIKFKEGIKTVFSRFSNDPNPIGVDIFEKDRHHLSQILSLIKETTNLNSRGIPFIIDKIDELIKIKNEHVDLLITNYLDSNIKEIYFTAKRRKR
jgi:hypothetical protein